MCTRFALNARCPRRNLRADPRRPGLTKPAAPQVEDKTESEILEKARKIEAALKRKRTAEKVRRLECVQAVLALPASAICHAFGQCHGHRKTCAPTLYQISHKRLALYFLRRPLRDRAMAQSTPLHTSCCHLSGVWRCAAQWQQDNARNPATLRQSSSRSASSFQWRVGTNVCVRRCQL
jgi:hypothetical protein